MRRFSRTVRFGKTPRPSGIVHTPSRASASGLAPLTWRPATCTPPAVGDHLAAGHLEGRGLAGAVRAEQRHDRRGRHREVDAVQHLDAAVRGADRRRSSSDRAAVVGRRIGCSVIERLGGRPARRRGRRRCTRLSSCTSAACRRPAPRRSRARRRCEQSRITSGTSCSTSRMPMPVAGQPARGARRSASVSASSWPEAGSSSSSSRGRVARARASSTRRARPVGSSSARVSATSPHAHEVDERVGLLVGQDPAAGRRRPSRAAPGRPRPAAPPRLGDGGEPAGSSAGAARRRPGRSPER